MSSAERRLVSSAIGGTQVSGKAGEMRERAAAALPVAAAEADDAGGGAIADREVGIAVRHDPDALVEVYEHDQIGRQRTQLGRRGARHQRARIDRAASGGA